MENYKVVCKVQERNRKKGTLIGATTLIRAIQLINEHNKEYVCIIAHVSVKNNILCLYRGVQTPHINSPLNKGAQYPLAVRRGKGIGNKYKQIDIG